MSQPVPNFVSEDPEYVPKKIECPECADEMEHDGLAFYPGRVYAEYSCMNEDCPTTVRLTFEKKKIIKAECFRIYQGCQDFYDFTSKVGRILNPKVRP